MIYQAYLRCVLMFAFVDGGFGVSVVTSSISGTFNIQHSGNQLETTPTFPVLIIPGSELDHPGQTNIQDRYNCSRYQFSFEMTYPGVNPRAVTLTVTLSGRLAWYHLPECNIDWADGTSSTLYVNASSSSLSIGHTYAAYGVYPVAGSCTDSLVAHDTVVCPNHVTSCVTTSLFFDDLFKKVSTPLKYQATDQIVIKSLLRLNKTCSSSSSVGIIWRLTHVINSTYTEEISVTQPESSVLTLGYEVLDPGEYIVFLEVSHLGMGTNYWIDDFLFVYIVLPELVPSIDGGHLRYVSHGGIVYINATLSADPVTLLSSVTSLPLNTTWSLAHYTTKPNFTQFELFQKSFPISANLPTYPTAARKHVITQDNGYVLEINTTLFGVNTWAYVMFSMTRGDRKSSTLQIIKFVANAIPVKISCVFNCNKGRERKFRYDRLELDSVLSGSLSYGVFSFVWTLYQWDDGQSVWTGATQPTNRVERSIRIPETTWTEGVTYRIVLRVSNSSYTTTDVEIYGTVNRLPYGGTCTMSDITGYAARTWFGFTCTDWKGPDQRRSVSGSLDGNPLLTYTAYQHTVGALVEEEPILLTRSLQSYMILKLGDPNNTYVTTIKVHVTDIYKNYMEFDLVVTANPAFAWDQVTPDAAGKAIIVSYTNTDYAEDEQELVAMGKVDLIAPLVSSVCSHIHLIHLPQWTPPLPRRLNNDGSGVILDLKVGSNTDTASYGELVEEIQHDYDLATLALMEVMQNMTNVIRDSSKNFLANSTLETDKFLGSILTNAFTNLAARYQFTNDATQRDMVYLSDLIGTKNLDFKENFTVDASGEIEIVSGEVYSMSQAIVNNIVPNDLNQFIQIDNLKIGRTQISEMLSVVGKDIDIYNTSMSPAERTNLYLTMQKQLQIKLNEKKDTAKSAAEMTLKLFKDVQDKLPVCSTCTNYGNNITEQLIAKNTASVVKETEYSTKNATFRLDGIGEISGNASATGEETASISAVEFTENVFMYDDDQRSSSVTSNILHIDVKLSDTRVNPTSMTFKQSVKTPESNEYTPQVHEEDASEFSMHSYIYRYNTDSTCIVVRPQNETGITQYNMYVRTRFVPTILEYDFITAVKKGDNWKTCISPALMGGYTGLVYVGVQVPEYVRTVNYTFTLATLGCLTWDEGSCKWHSDKCDINWYESENILGCVCRNLTDLTFGNTFYAAANSIDFSTVFLKFSPLNQAAVIGALGGILVIYVIALVLVIPLDRKDLLKWGITPLRDNQFGDNHYYIIKVYTGLRKSAGTTSKIAFVLSGDNGDTGPRELFDGLRKEVSTGSIRSYFMATNENLGCLFHLYVWHDNSGEGNLASWYLNQVEVFDVATKQTTVFVAEKWLSADTDLDIEIKATTSQDTVHFDSRFFYQARDRLSDSHMWVSILYRPQASTFTRAQRASCALVYILLAMIANAIYFNPDDDYERVPAFQLGPFRFTMAQMFISIICALMTTPVVMIIVLLFKRSKAKKMSFEHSDDTRSRGCCCCSKKYELTYTEQLRRLVLSSGMPDFKAGFYFSHSCVYVAWVLIVFGALLPAFLIVLYSMEWGKQKSEEWLSTCLLSIAESMLLVDPIMVIFLSFVLACVIRKPIHQSNIDADQIVNIYKKRQGKDREGLDYCFHVLRSLSTDYDRNKREAPVIAPPLLGKTLNDAKDELRHNNRMTSVLMNLVLNVLLILVLSTICYSNRDERSYRHQEFIVNDIVDPNYFAHKTLFPRFNKIVSHGDVFDWVNETVFPSLFPEEDTTGQPLHWTFREYMTGYYNYRLGPPRIRQLRTSQGICRIPRYGTVRCYGEYTIASEHVTDYCIGWTEKHDSCPSYMILNNVSLPAWSFTSALDIWGLPIAGHYATYGGGGYIASFEINLNSSLDILRELYQQNWLDRQTRAVFFEFTVFCASTNMFIYSSFLVEFPETGGAVTSYSIYPMRLYNHVGPVGILTLVSEIIFVIYTIVLCVKLGVKIYQERCRIFRQFWILFDAVMLFISIGSIVVFIIRLMFTYLTIEEFKEDKRRFVNFSHIVFWDQILVSLLAFLVFMATLRILEAFGQAKKVQAVTEIFRKCGRDLLSFGTTFSFIFIGFCMLGYLLFGSQLKSYMSVYQTLGTLFVTMLGVSKYTEINDSHPVLAKVFFILYTVCIIFFVLSIFLSILGEAVDDVIKDTRRDTGEDIVEYMMTKFKSLIVGPTSTKGRANSSYRRSNKQTGGYNDKKTLPHMLSQGTSERVSLSRMSRIKISE